MMGKNTEFNGGIIGRGNAFFDKVFLFYKDEKVLIGSNKSSDIVVGGKLSNHVYCQIMYDVNLEEYYVKPLEKKIVFLESGQPLGKDRIYSIPRGMVLIIDNSMNRFELA